MNKVLITKEQSEALFTYIQKLNVEAEQEAVIASAKIVGVMKALEILRIELKEEVKY